MKDHPLVSLVVPCLNRGRFLKPTIESMLRQDYPYVECTVIDGGSTDETIEVLRSYGDRIRWISEPDEGHADAINKGWKLSRGEILAWLNADDVWVVPDAARNAVTYLATHPDVDVIYGDCGAIDEEGNQVGLAYLHEWNLEYAVEFCDHCIPQPAAFIRKTILEKVGWLDTDFYQKKDHELWLRISLVGQIRHVPILLAQQRNTPGLSLDAKTAAPACVQVTRKFFSLPGVPKTLLEKKRRALSNSYLRGSDYAWYHQRLWRIVFWYTWMAAVTDFSNSRHSFFYLRNRVSSAADANRMFKFVLWALDMAAFPFKILFRIRRFVSALAP